MEILVSELGHGEIEEFCELIREVYDEFVAPDYPDEGNAEFHSFLTEKNIHDRMHNGQITVCAKAGGRMAGACGFRDVSHLSLFFVGRDYQNRGVGRMMFAYALRKIKKDHPEEKVITVNSSPYALAVYKRLGFVQTGERQQKNGIISYPMEYEI